MTFFSSLQTILEHPHNKEKIFSTLGRVIWWKCNQLFFHQPSLVTVAGNIQMICDPASSYGSFVVYALFPEYWEFVFLQSYLETTDVFFDVGSHTGHYSLVAASKILSGHIYAFEPTPSNNKLIKKNVAINQLEKTITVEEMAISNAVGWSNFVLEKESEVNHLEYEKSRIATGKVQKVKTTTLDNYTLKKNISSISFLKIDTEGAELLILEGAKRLLKNQKIDVILFELNPKVEDFFNYKNKICSLLDKNKYHLFEFTDQGNLTEINSELLDPEKTINVIAMSQRTRKNKKIRSFFYGN